MSRLRLQRENRRGHDPEAPAAAHRKLLEIKAVILLPAWAPKQMHGRLGGTCHKLHCKKITAYVSISQETRAASIGRNHAARSEEHTSELQSLMRISYAVFCLKTKKKTHTINQ